MDDPQSEMANESSKTAAKNSIRFAVTSVPFKEENEETDELHNESTRQSAADNTIGYSTHEAVPMTVFYRNELSQGKPKGKARPTLDQLRKGFENESSATQV